MLRLLILTMLLALLFVVYWNYDKIFDFSKNQPKQLIKSEEYKEHKEHMKPNINDIEFEDSSIDMTFGSCDNNESDSVSFSFSDDSKSFNYDDMTNKSGYTNFTLSDLN